MHTKPRSGSLQAASQVNTQGSWSPGNIQLQVIVHADIGLKYRPFQVRMTWLPLIRLEDSCILPPDNLKAE